MISERSAAAGAHSDTRLAVIGTAGHIDHGKTALVRRLTGIDTDRLPEEKARGISIDLGFANLTTPAGRRVGIVDVPGHERFVRNMLAGVTGIDLVLLVIAADEGVMPQTREHFAIVSLLDVRRGIVVLTKTDLVADPEWLLVVEGDVREMVRGSFLDGAPILHFSARTGAGESELLAAIDRELDETENRSFDEPMRLPVDRSFVVEGFGTVVTGTLWRGRVRVGDEIEILPAGTATRVRSVQVHGAQVEEARGGQRTAIALHGVSREEVGRGQWLVAPGSLAATQLLNARVRVLAGAPRALKDRARVRFHLGSAEILGRVALIEGGALAPGESGLAQISLEQPTVAARGDRFVLRSYSPMLTFGGGTVLESSATRRRRGDVSGLAVSESGTEDERLLAVLAGTRGKPMNAVALAKALEISEAQAAERARTAALAGSARALSGGQWITSAAWDAARESIRAALAAFARKRPVRWGRTKGELKSELGRGLDAVVFDDALRSLIESGEVEARADHVRLPGGGEWTSAMEAARARVVAALESSSYSVPDMAALTVASGLPDALEHVQRLIFDALAVRVSQDFVYTKKQWDAIEDGLRKHFEAQATLSVGDLKQLFGVSRKHAIPLLEYGDRAGITLRVGDERQRGPKL